MNKKIFLPALLFLLFCLAGCENAVLPDETPSEPPTETVTEAEEDSQIDALLSSMTLEEKVYQLFFVRPESVTDVGCATQAGETTKEKIAERPVGGIIYFSKNIKSREQISQMIENTQSYSKIGLFIGVDQEGGSVSRLDKIGFTKIKPMAQVETALEAEKIGETLGSGLRDLGFNVDFAPVADVLVNENNSEIGDRSFGSDPAHVSEMVAALTRCIQKYGVSATLKHFPGHGSATVNSHTGRSESTRTLSELRETELLPFKAGIDEGCDFVMVSHITFVNIVDDNLPSSLSSEIITDLLKTELDFQGIVITDALEMGAITDSFTSGEAAVTAIKSGADMLLMPQNLTEAHAALVSAVQNGEISERRIDESVRKILKLKEEKGLLK